MMIGKEKCCSQKARLLATFHSPAQQSLFSSPVGISVTWQVYSLLLIVLRALQNLLSVLATVLVARSFIDLLLYTVYHCPGLEHNHLSQMALLVLNHSVSQKKMQTLLYSSPTMKSFWPYCRSGTLTLSLIDVLEQGLQRLLQNFLVSVPISATLN